MRIWNFCKKKNKKKIYIYKKNISIRKTIGLCCFLANSKSATNFSLQRVIPTRDFRRRRRSPSWRGLSTLRPAPSTYLQSQTRPGPSRSSSFSTPTPPAPPPLVHRRRLFSKNGRRRWNGRVWRIGLSCFFRVTVGFGPINGANICNLTSWLESPSASCLFLRYRRRISSIKKFQYGDMNLFNACDESRN